MSEDLTTDEGEEIEVEFETTTRTDYINAATTAINALDTMDTMTNEDAKRKKRIIRKSLKIIDNIISEMHDEIFESDEED